MTAKMVCNGTRRNLDMHESNERKAYRNHIVSTVPSSSCTAPKARIVTTTVQTELYPDEK